MANTLLRACYSALFYLTMPLILLRLFLLGIRNRGYWERWYQRLGFVPQLTPGRERCWIHAVSVGEAKAASTLLPRLRSLWPDLEVVISTGTPTGAAVVQQFGPDVTHFYVPYDLPIVLKRFLRRVDPKVLVILETELWPNMLHACHRSDIPVILVNARLSVRSYQGYRRISSLVADMLANLTAVAVQTVDDAERLCALGLDEDKVMVTGSVKFDLSLPEDIAERSNQLRQRLGDHRPVWIAASTHEGEETPILAVHQQVLATHPKALLLIAPRHPERFAKVTAYARDHGFLVARYSDGQTVSTQQAVFVIDTMGELPYFYALSDVAFVGGSLVATGGHNPLEPAAAGIPVVMGPHTFNFSEITQRLLRHGALSVANDQAGLSRCILQLLSDPALRQRAGAHAFHFVEDNRGAADKVASLIYQVVCAQRSSVGSALKCSWGRS